RPRERWLGRPRNAAPLPAHSAHLETPRPGRAGLTAKWLRPRRAPHPPRASAVLPSPRSGQPIWQPQSERSAAVVPLEALVREGEGAVLVVVRRGEQRVELGGVEAAVAVGVPLGRELRQARRLLLLLLLAEG